MKLIKNILLGLGAIFAILIVAVVYLFGESSDFKKEHEQFVKDYISEFSQEWDISSVSDQSTNELLVNIATPSGQNVINLFRAYGKVVEINDVTLNNYSTHAGGATTGEFLLNTKFENAKAMVTVIVQEKESGIKVDGFHIKPLSEVKSAREVKA